MYDEQRQSPWLDNLIRTYLRDGTLARFVHDGIRGVTANPTIFAKAIEGSDAYDEQFAALTASGTSIIDAYWDLVIDDVRGALALLRPTLDASGGLHGYVSIEVAPELAHDTDGTITAARHLRARIDAPNVFVKIAATAEGHHGDKRAMGMAWAWRRCWPRDWGPRCRSCRRPWGRRCGQGWLQADPRPTGGGYRCRVPLSEFNVLQVIEAVDGATERRMLCGC